jgi:hypothetical protein
MSDIVVCSFFTDDDYYRTHGKELEENLIDLGIDHELTKVSIDPRIDWVDICRKKVPYLHSVCAENPDKKVFWIDVDCRLLEIPDFILQSTADVIGFQRGFSPPIAIGYRNHARFWEPCFWGIGTSHNARQMIIDAANAEKRSTIKATDDFFFEEGWRANADALTFQIIPSACVAGKQTSSTTHPAFFVFGSSGNVTEYKKTAAQHLREQRPKWLRKKLLNTGKKVLSSFPKKISRHIIATSDQIGLTHYLLGYNRSGVSDGRSQTQRRDITNRILRSGINGEIELLEELAEDLCSSSIVNPNELATIEAARSFVHYSSKKSDKRIDLSWWVRPFPGNFGDWLSPFLLSHYSDCRISFQTPTAPTRNTPKHLVAVGSIARFIKSNSIVVGTGISSYEYPIEIQAKYLSVRGPLTAEFLRSCGGPSIDSFGDPAVLISRIIPLQRGETNGRIALIRHASHDRVPLTLPENFDELSVLVSHPEHIRTFLHELIKYDEVITSALHVLISCQSYGIPCSLVTFEGLENSVSGTGLKYPDYSLGVGLKELHPIVVERDLRRIPLEKTRQTEIVSESVKDQIEEKLLEGIQEIRKQRTT